MDPEPSHRTDPDTGSAAPAEPPTGHRTDAAASGAETRERLLDVAERLFADLGYEAASLRAVTGEAGANLAAVHYHFGSKEGLFAAVFRRRVGPVNGARLERLRELSERGAPTLVEVVDALFRPVVELARSPGGENFVRLVARLLADPGEHAAAIRAEFEEVRARFFPVLVGLLPHLEPEELVLRLQLALGSMCAILSRAHGIAAHVCVTSRVVDPRRRADELVAFVSAGLAAPSSGATTEEPS
ncbi:MAG: TetR/AcrR family transcriptional regulator [Planctomycetota bacterium]